MLIVKHLSDTTIYHWICRTKTNGNIWMKILLTCKTYRFQIDLLYSQVYFMARYDIFNFFCSFELLVFFIRILKEVKAVPLVNEIFYDSLQKEIAWVWYKKGLYTCLLISCIVILWIENTNRDEIDKCRRANAITPFMIL